MFQQLNPLQCVALVGFLFVLLIPIIFIVYNARNKQR